MAESRLKARAPGQRAAATATEASNNGAVEEDLFAGLPRRAPEDLDDLARAQGVSLEADFDALVGDFWPEDESCDDFIAAYRSWRHAGRDRRR